MHTMNERQTTQEFCLRWNNHCSTLLTVFDNLFTNESLVDVTLFAEGQMRKAHRVVLSACSPYFETLFAQTTDKHPLVILKDVKFEHLKALLEYMYKGQVNVAEDMIGPLFKTAQSLKIKGLAEGNKEAIDMKGTSVYFSQPRPMRQTDTPIKMPSTVALDIKPRALPHEIYSSPTTSSIPSVLSTALTMPPALSLASPLELNHFSSLPPSLASTLASSLTTSIGPLTSPFLPPRHDLAPRMNEDISPHPKRRKKYRKRSGGAESGDSDCHSSSSPGDSVSNLSLPRIPATITPIAHGQQQLEPVQQKARDLSSNSSNHLYSRVHNDYRENASGLPPTTSHHPINTNPHLSSTSPLLLPAHKQSQQVQEFPEDLKQHPDYAENSYKNSHDSVPLVQNNHKESNNRDDSRSPSIERNCSSRNSRREENNLETSRQKVSPLNKSTSDPEMNSPIKMTPSRSQSHSRVEDTSSDNNPSEDEGDEANSSGTNDKQNERISGDAVGPSTSKPHNDEQSQNPNYLTWNYKQDSSSAEESHPNLIENTASPGFWKNSLGPYLCHSPLEPLSPSLRPPGLAPTFPGLYTSPGAMSPSWGRSNGSPPPTPQGMMTLPGRSNECSRCGRLYKTRKGLKHHIKNECGVEPRFQCSHCDWKFKQKAHLLRHMARKHTIS